VLLANESQTAGWDTRQGSGPPVSIPGPSATSLSEARLAGDQRGHENEGIGGQFQEPWVCRPGCVPRFGGICNRCHSAVVASGRSEALFKGQALADRGGWRRIERKSELAVESGTASVGGRISSHHCCIPYPTGSFEVESDRSSDVQPDQ